MASFSELPPLKLELFWGPSKAVGEEQHDLGIEIGFGGCVLHEVVQLIDTDRIAGVILV